MKNKGNLFLTLLVLTCMVTTSLADTPGVQTLTLNTGFDHSANAKYPAPGSYPSAGDPRDAYWILVRDTSTTGNTTPRSSSIMPKYGSAWANPFSDTEWISYVKNGVPTSNGSHFRDYVFEKCFCVKKGALTNKENMENARLDISFRADDYGAVYLNESLTNITSQTIPTNPFTSLNTPAPYSILSGSLTSGGFNLPSPPASTVIKGRELLKRLKEGRNCLQFKVVDLGLVVSGYDLTGSLTLSGIEEVEKFNERAKRPEFSQCSSCSRRQGPKSEESQ
ncbi:MAG: hypothetical protein ACKVQW_10185 [Pyrinomonadaceae bacterium]